MHLSMATLGKTKKQKTGLSQKQAFQKATCKNIHVKKRYVEDAYMQWWDPACSIKAITRIMRSLTDTGDWGKVAQLTFTAKIGLELSFLLMIQKSPGRILCLTCN